MDILDSGFWAIVAGSAFLLIVLFSTIGGFLESRMKKDSPGYKNAGMVMMLVMLGLCIILAISAVPLIIITVLGFQEVIGNSDVPAIGFLLDHRSDMIVCLWSILILGSLIAIPAMLNDMKKEK